MTDYSFEFTHAITRRPARSVVNGLRAGWRPSSFQMVSNHP